MPAPLTAKVITHLASREQPYPRHLTEAEAKTLEAVQGNALAIAGLGIKLRSTANALGLADPIHAKAKRKVEKEKPADEEDEDELPADDSDEEDDSDDEDDADEDKPATKRKAVTAASLQRDMLQACQAHREKHLAGLAMPASRPPVAPTAQRFDASKVLGAAYRR